MSADIDAKVEEILADTKAHGFEFQSETVHQDGTPYKAEIVRITDVLLFEAAFPGVIIKDENGSSRRVASQAISRNSRGKKSPRQLWVANIKQLLGVEEQTVREVEVYMFHGKRYDTAEEMDEAVEL